MQAGRGWSAEDKGTGPAPRHQSPAPLGESRAPKEGAARPDLPGCDCYWAAGVSFTRK